MRFEALEITIHDTGIPSRLMELLRYIQNSFCEARHIPIKIIVNSKGTYVQYESNANI